MRGVVDVVRRVHLIETWKNNRTQELERLLGRLLTEADWGNIQYSFLDDAFTFSEPLLTEVKRAVAAKENQDNQGA